MKRVIGYFEICLKKEITFLFSNFYSKKRQQFNLQTIYLRQSKKKIFIFLS